MKRVLRIVAVLAATMAALALGVASPASAAAPTITSFTPTSGGYNTVVTINGTGFTSPATVKFGLGQATVVTVVSSVKLTANVPVNATTGQITVTDAGGTAVSSTNFTVTPFLSITPLAASAGSTVNVSGGGFAAFEAVDVYLGTSDVALVTTDSGGRFTYALTLPATAPPGPLWVTAVGRRSGQAAQKAVTIQTNWPQFHGGPTHQGSNSKEVLLSPSSVGRLDQKWTYGSGSSSASSVAVVGGVVYGASGSGVYAVTESTGARRWSHPMIAVSPSSPAVVGGLVYVGDDGGKIYALNAADGTIKWSYLTGDSIYGSPAVVNGVVYVGSYDGTVKALNASTGALEWSYLCDGPVYASPAVAGGRVFIASESGTVYGLDASTGDLSWSYATGATVDASPTVASGTVYVGSSDHMYALRAASGALRWSYAMPAGAGIGSTAAVADNRVVFGALDGQLYALSASDGSLSWSQVVGGTVNSSPAIADGVVYVGSNNGSVRAYDESNGGALWQGTTGSTIYSSPTVVDGHVLVESQDGLLYDWELASTPALAARPHVSQLRPDHTLRPSTSVTAHEHARGGVRHLRS